MRTTALCDRFRSMTNPSLKMSVDLVDGRWVIGAPWLKEPVMAATWIEAYWMAVLAISNR